MELLVLDGIVGTGGLIEGFPVGLGLELGCIPGEALGVGTIIVGGSGEGS